MSFGTPKPERLIERVLHIATNPGDLVLDSFAGSGTTGAVAHKMGRRWIMVELGEHCHTHIIPRMHKVIDGEDPGGVTKAVGLEGRRRLPLLPAGALAAGKGPLGQLGHQSRVQRRDAGGGAVQAGGLHLCAVRYALVAARPFDGAGLHLGDHAEPRRRAVAGAVRGGRAGTLAAGALHGLSRCQRRCGRRALAEPDRQEIPKVVLARSGWGRDDYSLNVANLPMAQPEPPADPHGEPRRPSSRPSRARGAGEGVQGSLFGDEEP